MSYSFEYIDIILLAMIAGFIFLRLRGILGRKTGFEDGIRSGYEEKLSQELNSGIAGKYLFLMSSNNFYKFDYVC